MAERPAQTRAAVSSMAVRGRDLGACRVAGGGVRARAHGAAAVVGIVSGRAAGAANGTSGVPGGVHAARGTRAAPAGGRVEDGAVIRSGFVSFNGSCESCRINEVRAWSRFVAYGRAVRICARMTTNVPTSSPLSSARPGQGDFSVWCFIFSSVYSAPRVSAGVPLAALLQTRARRSQHERPPAWAGQYG